jgi:hypothetical protein
VVAGDGASKLRKEGELAAVVRGRIGSYTGPFIGAGRRWLGWAEHAELTQPSMAVWKNLDMDSAGGIRGDLIGGVVGRDLSGRAWWQRAGRREATRGGRRRPAVVVAQR